MIVKRIVPLMGFLGVIHFFGVTDVQACAPLPVLLYPVEEVYEEKGLEIPDLPDDAIAVIDGEYIAKSDYKQWLYRKIGFEPIFRQTFAVQQRLEEVLQDQGLDLEQEFEQILDHFYRYELRGRPYEDLDTWHAQSERLARTEEPETYRYSVTSRIQRSYLDVLYLRENWDEIHAAVLAEHGVDHDILSVGEGDPELYPILRILNAYAVWQRNASRIRPYIVQNMLVGQDLNLTGQTEEYIDWLYDRYNTKFVVENRLGMILSQWNAAEQELEISDAAVEKEFADRLADYEELVERFNQHLPDLAIPLEVSSVYTNYLMKETRDDFYKSKAHRRANPLQEHERMRRYYETYGFDGIRNEVREIFRWVRKQRGSSNNADYQEYLASEKERIREELESLREEILSEGVDRFPVFAIAANDDPELQEAGGKIDLVARYGAASERWGAVQEHVAELEELDLHELSPIMEGPWNTLDLFWLAETNENERVYHLISKKLPRLQGFDHVAYKEDRAAAYEKLEGLKAQIEEGASFEDLAEAYSDSYGRYGVDVSDLYQERYGYAFAKAVSKIPEGEMGIVESDEGVHLLHVRSRTVTPLTDDIRDEIEQAYRLELASQDDRYEVTKQHLFEADPYFRTD